MRYRTSFDRAEGRRDRRHPLPSLAVTLENGRYQTINWSLGGFLLAGYKQFHLPGEVIEGSFSIAIGGAEFDFKAEVVRADTDAGTLALQFTELPSRAVDHLDKALARRIVRRD
jgi:hypothetical protein